MPDLLVNIDVDDLEKAITFYARGLGLKAGCRLGPGACEMVGASSPIYLLANPFGTPPFSGATSGRGYGRHWTPVHLDFAVDNLEVAVDRARSAGARLEGPIEERVWGADGQDGRPFRSWFLPPAVQGQGLR